MQWICIGEEFHAKVQDVSHLNRQKIIRKNIYQLKETSCSSILIWDAPNQFVTSIGGGGRSK